MPIGRGGCILSLFGEGEPLAVGVDRIYNSKSIIYNYRSIIPPRPLLNKSIGGTTPQEGNLAQSNSSILPTKEKGTDLIDQRQKKWIVEGRIPQNRSGRIWTYDLWPSSKSMIRTWFWVSSALPSCATPRWNAKSRIWTHDLPLKKWMLYRWAIFALTAYNYTYFYKFVKSWGG